MGDRLSTLVQRQKGQCKYCKRAMTSGGKYRATEDHVIPRSRGGSNAWRNIVAACNFCNTHKGSLSVDEFMAKLPALLAGREMVKRQRQALRRHLLVKFEDLPAYHKREHLKAVEADLSYAARSTAWAEPLATLLDKLNGESVQAISNLIREQDVDPSNPLSSGGD